MTKYWPFGVLKSPEVMTYFFLACVYAANAAAASVQRLLELAWSESSRYGSKLYGSIEQNALDLKLKVFFPIHIKKRISARARRLGDIGSFLMAVSIYPLALEVKTDSLGREADPRWRHGRWQWIGGIVSRRPLSNNFRRFLWWKKLLLRGTLRPLIMF